MLRDGTDEFERKFSLRLSWCHSAVLCLVDFYARQRVMLSASLLRQRRPSVCLSVCPSVTLLYCVKTTQLRVMKSSPYDSPESLVSNEVILVPLGEEIPLAQGHQRGVPPL